jgi:hypothetical protein
MPTIRERSPTSDWYSQCIKKHTKPSFVASTLFSSILQVRKLRFREAAKDHTARTPSQTKLSNGSCLTSQYPCRVCSHSLHPFSDGLSAPARNYLVSS